MPMCDFNKHRLRASSRSNSNRSSLTKDENANVDKSRLGKEVLVAVKYLLIKHLKTLCFDNLNKTD